MVRFLVDAAKFLGKNSMPIPSISSFLSDCVQEFVQATVSLFGTSNLDDACARLKNDIDVSHFLTSVINVLCDSAYFQDCFFLI